MKIELKKGSKYLELLRLAYPDARCALNHRSSYELIVATILSAQCTDERVNLVTPALFKRCPSPAELSEIETGELEALIKSTGFFRNKAKSLKGAAKMIVEEYGGKVPQEMADLIRLPGVARKTANVVLGTALGKNEGVVVDTHVQRLSIRMGLSDNSSPEKIEKDLMAIFPREAWTDVAHMLAAHGRSVCKARKPACGSCPLVSICPQNGIGG